MTTKEFIKKYKECRELKTLKEAEEKITIFWETLREVIGNEKVIFKNFGKFELKEQRGKRYILPYTEKIEHSKEKIKISFKSGKYLKNSLNQ